MDQDTWSKSLLVGYNYLPIVAKCIDASNMQMALGSFSYQGNALDLMEKMIANNKRERALINAKVIVDTTLEMLKERNREVLRLRYIKRKSFEQIAAIMNICLRSVFRWHDVAIKQFSSMCILRGYDEKWMEDNYAHDSLFERCALRCQQDNEYGQIDVKSNKEKFESIKARHDSRTKLNAKREAPVDSVGGVSLTVGLLRKAN